MSAAHALHIVPNPDTARVDAAADELEQPVSVPGWWDTPDADLTYRYDIDPEASLLCALLWSDTATAAPVIAQLHATDFYRGAHGELFEMIAALSAAGKPHTPPNLIAAIHAAGKNRDGMQRVILGITGAGTVGFQAPHLAIAVVQAAYRRQFTIAIDRLRQAADECPVEDLFEHMVTHGREQRTAKQRLDDVIEALG